MNERDLRETGERAPWRYKLKDEDWELYTNLNRTHVRTKIVTHGVPVRAKNVSLKYLLYILAYEPDLLF